VTVVAAECSLDLADRVALGLADLLTVLGMGVCHALSEADDEAAVVLELLLRGFGLKQRDGAAEVR
jgi:hypothetical protein